MTPTTENLIFVGTLHGKLTPHDELETLLTSLQPDLVLVELTDTELVRGDTEDLFRDEMLFAYRWTKEHDVRADTFDADINVLRDGLTGQEEQFIKDNQAFGEEISRHDWKALNLAAAWDPNTALGHLNQRIKDSYMDSTRCLEREEMMISAIREKADPAGTTLVLAGTDHLDAFERAFPDARFPLRSNPTPNEA